MAHSRDARRKGPRVMLGVVLVLLAALGSIGGWYWSFQKKLEPVGSQFEPSLFRIREGQSLAQVADRLKERNLIRDPGAFRLYMRWQGWDAKVQAGEYEFSPDQSSQTIGEMIANRKITRNWIMIPEGLRLDQVAERLEKHGAAAKADFLRYARSPESFKDTVKMPLPEGTLEGYLMPNTYRIPPGSGAVSAISKMLKATEEQVYEPLKSQLKGRSFHEILTVAAMIEREAMHEEDRPKIASVIYNRLEDGMRLQIDATVQYAHGYWKRRILYKDLEIDSPYNTYRRSGLPPGPIANPGLACIRAALNPSETDYRFYVAKPDGYHIFTATYAEHQRAIEQARALREKKNSGGSS